MDLETENQLAALLMEEARRLRAEADKDGVHAYLRQPKVRGRPNARFLTATVLGVQQANKAVEVDELWRAREKELELENKLTRKAKSDEKYEYGKHNDSRKCYRTRHEKVGSSSSKHAGCEDVQLFEDGGLSDEELEKFLNSRAKRGRGTVGSRMDEPGPYPAHSTPDCEGGTPDTRTHEEWEGRVLGPEKPPSLPLQHPVIPFPKKTDKAKSSCSKNHRSKAKHEKEEPSKRKRRKEKSSRHRH